MREDELEELRQVVRFRRHRAGFDETRLEILFHALLAVKTLHVWRAIFAPTAQARSDGEILLRFFHPLTSDRPHKATSPGPGFRG